MERANYQDKGKRIVEDVSVELTLGLSGFGASSKKPKILNHSSSMANGEHSGYNNSNRNVNDFQFSVIRPASLPMETEAEWRQMNDPFSIMKTSSLPMESEMQWRQSNDPFSVTRSPMETEMEYWRQRNDPFYVTRTSSLPMETEIDWRQRNDPYSIMKTYSLPMESEVEWRKRNDPFSVTRTSSFPMETEMEWRQRMETEMEWRQRMETEIEWRRRMETEMEYWRQMNDPFSIMKTASLPPMETEIEWMQRSDPFSVNRTASLPPMETEEEWMQSNNDPFSTMRTASLPPMETEMDWKERRDFQTQMRRDAKQKRWDKLKNVIVVEENEVNGTSSWPSSGGSGSQGSVGSSETGFETPQQLPNQVNDTSIAGASGSSNAIPPASGTLEQMQHLIVAAIEATNDQQSPDFSGKEGLRNFLLKMPGVSTKGDGSNGKKTEGFLYAYKKGGEVKIVCICHGHFLTPAEFVKHAGGGDVENPLKLITIDPN